RGIHLRHVLVRADIGVCKFHGNRFRWCRGCYLRHQSLGFPYYGGTARKLHRPERAGLAGSTAGARFTEVVLRPRHTLACQRKLSSTYFGGPSDDQIGDTALGPDGSVYFLNRWLIASNSDMPTSRGALLANCTPQPNTCYEGYAAKLSPALDKEIFGTYIPGI